MSEPLHSRKTFRHRLEQMLSVLRGEIRTGKRLPGQFLPSERDLVRQFQLSNKLVRVGLEQLVSEGLIVKIPRVGNKIADVLDMGTVTLRFGYHSSLEQEAAMDQLLAEFHISHPNIQVHAIPIAFENYDETVKEYLDTGMLDVVTMNYNNFDQFRSNGRLDLFMQLEPEAGVYPNVESIFVHDHRLYARPFLFSPLILCYNLDHLREKGMREPFQPDSWKDLLEQASQLSVDNERFGFYFFLLSKNRWPVFFLQNEAKLDCGREQLAEPVERMIQGLSLCREMIYATDTFPTFLSGSDADAEELFVQGKVSVIMTSYFSLNSLRDSGIRFDIAPLPGTRNADTILMAVGLAVNSKSKAIVAAQSLANFFISERAQMIIRNQTLSIPALIKAAESISQSSLYRPPHFTIFQNLLPRSRLVTDLNVSLTEMELIMKEARLFWSRLQTKGTLRERILAILNNHS